MARMNPLKGVVALISSFTLVLGLTACGSDSSTETADGDLETIRVATSTGPYSKLFQEDLRPELILVATTTEDKADMPWTKAVVDAYRSEEFRQFFDENNTNNY